MNFISNLKWQIDDNEIFREGPYERDSPHLAGSVLGLNPSLGATMKL